METAKNVLHPCGKRAAGDTIVAFVSYCDRFQPLAKAGEDRDYREDTRLCLKRIFFRFGVTLLSGDHTVALCGVFFFSILSTPGAVSICSIVKSDSEF